MGKLDVKALALACGLLWGGAILILGLGAALCAGGSETWYAKGFLEVVASIYPGYGGRPEVGDTLIGAAYAFVDGAVGGALLAALYNLFARRRPEPPADVTP